MRLSPDVNSYSKLEKCRSINMTLESVVLCIPDAVKLDGALSCIFFFYVSICSYIWL